MRHPFVLNGAAILLHVNTFQVEFTDFIYPLYIIKVQLDQRYNYNQDFHINFYIYNIISHIFDFILNLIMLKISALMYKNSHRN